jgi:hypothetical protein
MKEIKRHTFAFQGHTYHIAIFEDATQFKVAGFRDDGTPASVGYLINKEDAAVLARLSRADPIAPAASMIKDFIEGKTKFL